MSDKEMNQAEIEKIHAEIAKLIAETAKIQRETMWYPFVVSTGLVAGIIALTKLLL